MNLQTIVDQALIQAAERQPGGFPLADVADAVATQCSDLPRQAPERAVWLRLNGEPLLDGIARTMQLAVAGARMAKGSIPSVEALLELARAAHPDADEDDVLGALFQYGDHQRRMGEIHLRRAAKLAPPRALRLVTDNGSAGGAR